MVRTFRVDEYWCFIDGSIYVNYYVVIMWDPKVLGSRVCAVLWALKIVLLLSFIGTPEWAPSGPGGTFRVQARL